MSEPIEDRQPLLTPRRIVALVLIALFVVFALQNGDDTTIRALVVEVTAPLWLALLGSFVLGAAVAWLLLYRRRRR